VFCLREKRPVIVSCLLAETRTCSDLTKLVRRAANAETPSLAKPITLTSRPQKRGAQRGRLQPDVSLLLSCSNLLCDTITGHLCIGGELELLQHDFANGLSMPVVSKP
jgi:hypothetical protein